MGRKPAQPSFVSKIRPHLSMIIWGALAVVVVGFALRGVTFYFSGPISIIIR
jgi:hypothetical protein